MTVVTASGNTLFSNELARALRRSVEWVEAILGESASDGVVERASEGWRLTAEAERRFGAALRGMADDYEGLNVISPGGLT